MMTGAFRNHRLNPDAIFLGRNFGLLSVDVVPDTGQYRLDVSVYDVLSNNVVLSHQVFSDKIGSSSVGNRVFKIHYNEFARYPRGYGDAALLLLFLLVVSQVVAVSIVGLQCCRKKCGKLL